ncbi:hypothetical protein GCM10028803_21910 [Larkinella knui]|uniref:DUF5908 family protein n=1 Tax=Larkinella knui TaxID=2025310 RepID=UPI00163A0118|nr:DUF5908 family protein [Larkinella knui]
MPIEIRELHIKVVVNGGKNHPEPKPLDVARLKQEITTACVNKVLQKLKEKAER